MHLLYDHTNQFLLPFELICEKSKNKNKQEMKNSVSTISKCHDYRDIKTAGSSFMLCKIEVLNSFPIAN